MGVRYLPVVGTFQFNICIPHRSLSPAAVETFKARDMVNIL